MIQSPYNISSFIDIKEVPPSTAKKLGKITTHQKNNFINFLPEKQSNTIRIGCFGDSFTQGSEVSDIYDYPAFLQDMYEESGHNNIEVINFGSEWFGFQQTFIMWEDIGTTYNLDYVLLGPTTFYPDRERTFNHSKGESPYYLRARYILKNNVVKLINVIGDTYGERFNHYYRFIPHFNYLIYDENPPAFLQSLIPTGRALKNPFYYLRENSIDETSEIYRLLLLEMASSASSIIVGNFEEWIVSLAKSLHRENLDSVFLYRPKHFPYLMPFDHQSPLGNYIVAKQYYDKITKKKNSNLTLIKTDNINSAPPTSSGATNTALFKYTDIELELNGNMIGSFVDTDKWISGPKALKGSRTISLLSIKRPGLSILDSLFVPLDFEIKNGMEMTLHARINGKNITHVLGYVKMPFKGINIGEIEINGIDSIMRWKNNHMFFSKMDLENISLKKLFTEKYSAIVSLDNTKIFETKIVKPGEKMKLFPLRTGFRRARANGNVFIDVDKLPNTGIINLVLTPRKGNTIKMPFGKWEKIHITVPLNN